MRLLNTRTGEIREFYSEDAPKKYAVLSHRWGHPRQEVSYQEWEHRSSRIEVRSRQGFQKIEKCCKLVNSEQEGEKDENSKVEWVWIDTCCIDKNSSQELSEAINSMFRWYEESSVCYVHLDDYAKDTLDLHALRECKWFLRGWTLQELIAPRDVKIYNKDWSYLGAKSDTEMCKAISEITSIDESILLHKVSHGSASIAKRMSWASKRVTTRTEDTAYCLLGLFDINLPLLYGEGPKAFKRLQEEIMKTYPEDHSLYAWGIPVEKFSNHIENIQDEFDKFLPATSEPLYGLLAESPKDFEFSGNFAPIHFAEAFYVAVDRAHKKADPPLVLGSQVRIELPFSKSISFHYSLGEPPVSQLRWGISGMLLCNDDRDKSAGISLPLLLWGSGQYSRYKELQILPRYWVGKDSHNIKSNTSTITVAKERKPELASGDIIIRRMHDCRTSIANKNKETIFIITNSSLPVQRDRAEIIYVEPSLTGNFSGMIFSANSKELAFVIGRIQEKTDDHPQLQVGLIPKANPGTSCFEGRYIWNRVLRNRTDHVSVDIDLFSVLKIDSERHELPGEDGGFINTLDITIRDSLSAVEQWHLGQNSSGSSYSSSDGGTGVISEDSSGEDEHSDGRTQLEMMAGGQNTLVIREVKTRTDPAEVFNDGTTEEEVADKAATGGGSDVAE
ncbi:hypothetical protein JX265_007172 [Neoarthrinium moseri]|uniref:Heterokaryon incompatibility domain-containing protein n=1 Tax=Neoarthrinium moseri TaxID=1658444 RepID=A0A9Q0ANL1_9PEZI|nr:uncharacterized protein JN550_010071 [Neoarthrinium moseri]KAI1862734.1 hypothetical protein JN550_010071 [Neoarthrinium moseri]KAI1868349.1 hypothetical protein JX265_007172 [Neoarthrinium moseri]